MNLRSSHGDTFDMLYYCYRHASAHQIRFTRIESPDAEAQPQRSLRPAEVLAIYTGEVRSALLTCEDLPPSSNMLR